MASARAVPGQGAAAPVVVVVVATLEVRCRRIVEVRRLLGGNPRQGKAVVEGLVEGLVGTWIADDRLDMADWLLLPVVKLEQAGMLWAAVGLAEAAEELIRTGTAQQCSAGTAVVDIAEGQADVAALVRSDSLAAPFVEVEAALGVHSGPARQSLRVEATVLLASVGEAVASGGQDVEEIVCYSLVL